MMTSPLPKQSIRHCRVRHPTPAIGASVPWLHHTGISKPTVHRWFQLLHLQPHRYRHFKISTDPFFVGKVHDTVGLCLRRPDHAIVPCLGEKTQL